jgi:hypothetical protein
MKVELAADTTVRAGCTDLSCLVGTSQTSCLPFLSRPPRGTPARIVRRKRNAVLQRRIVGGGDLGVEPAVDGLDGLYPLELLADTDASQTEDALVVITVL